MGYDIGLKRVNETFSTRSAMKLRTQIRVQWACDITTIWSLEDVAPVFDANMMRIYADVYRKDISNLNEEQLCELATSYQQAIKVFVYQNLFDTITKVYRKWRALAQSNTNHQFSIPTNSLTLFDNLLTLHKQDPGADDTLQFNAFKSSLLRNSDEWFKSWNEDFDTSKYLIPKERLLMFMDIVERKIHGCFQKTNSNDSVAVDYHTKIKGVLEYMKVLLMIVYQARIDRKEDIIKFTERQSGIYRFTQFFEEDVLQSASEFARKYGLLPMAHLICLPTDTELDLKVQQANVSDVRMIEILFAYTKYIQDHLTWEGTEA